MTDRLHMRKDKLHTRDESAQEPPETAVYTCTEAQPGSWSRKDSGKRQPQPAVRKNREKAHHMSAGYVIFLVAALCAAAFILVNYIQLQADLTNLTKGVATKQSELNSLRSANDEKYNRIMNSIDLEEIKRIAIGELGMTYAKEGQIILYADEGDDYMRQVPGTKN